MTGKPFDEMSEINTYRLIVNICAELFRSHDQTKLNEAHRYSTTHLKDF